MESHTDASISAIDPYSCVVADGQTARRTLENFQVEYRVIDSPGEYCVTEHKPD